MKPPHADAVTLRSMLGGAGSTGKHRFIAAELDALDLGAAAAAPEHTHAAEALRGKAVLLAMPAQLDAAKAMIALDGVVRRMVLWPGGMTHAAMASVVQDAGIDCILHEWPPPLPMDAAGSTLPRACATEWVLLTSGTSGQPKLVLHTLETLSGHLWELPPQQPPVWATFYDIRRYGGLQVFLRALAGGGSLVLSSATEPPEAFLMRAAAAHATHILGTPSHWRRALLTGHAQDLNPIYVRLSGEIADQAILDRLRNSYPTATIVHAFASTEAGLVFEVADGLAGFPAALISAGASPLQTRIFEDCLQVGSPRNALGYLCGGLKPLNGCDGFVDTGDIVRRDGARYYYAGRRDGVVNVGGDKVHPEEIEGVVNQHPDVQMSRVRAKKSPITGAVVVAEIVRKRPPTLRDTPRPGELERDIITFCRGRLAPHKVPASVRIVESLDVAASGKIVRHVA